MIPKPYPLRPSDGASVPAVSGVLGITSPLPAVPPGGCSAPPLGRSSVPMPPRLPPSSELDSCTTRAFRTQTHAAPLGTRTRRSTRPQEGRSSQERGYLRRFRMKDRRTKKPLPAEVVHPSTCTDCGAMTTGGGN